MSHELDTGHVLDDLVQQFADPFAFFRELIQNAIDAGSLEVEVAFVWEGGDSPDKPGRLTIHIEDWGEGMNREIIEGKLTRLFSSGKDDDFTKIGKFGIGFVSVFAIKPDAVCVDTGRGGENWRVLFGPERDWQLIELEHPVEGTQIRVFKTLDNKQAADEFIARSRSVIRQWCRHVEVPIRIEGEDVREPFVVPDALVATRYEEEGTRIVAAVVNQAVAPFGFYNRGLLLQEGRDNTFPFIGFKIDSRYLEHTLTRDQVVRDKKYDKAMKLIERVVSKDLPDAVMDGLEQAARDHDFSSLRKHLMATVNAQIAVDPNREVVPLVGGGATTLNKARAAAKKRQLFLAEQVDELVHELAQRDDTLIVRARRDDPVDRYLHQLSITAEPHSASHSIIQEVGPDEFPAGADLVREVENVVRSLGAKPQWVGFGIIGPSEAFKFPLLGLVDRRGIIAHELVEDPSVESLRQATNIVIEPTREATKLALQLARTEPELAAYQLVKIAALATALDPTNDTLMATRALEGRTKRLGGAL